MLKALMPFATCLLVYDLSCSAQRSFTFNEGTHPEGTLTAADHQQKNMGAVVPAAHYNVIMVTPMHLFRITMQGTSRIASRAAHHV